jgi:hypothetical protein
MSASQIETAIIFATCLALYQSSCDAFYLHFPIIPAGSASRISPDLPTARAWGQACGSGALACQVSGPGGTALGGRGQGLRLPHGERERGATQSAEPGSAAFGARAAAIPSWPGNADPRCRFEVHPSPGRVDHLTEVAARAADSAGASAGTLLAAADAAASRSPIRRARRPWAIIQAMMAALTT